MVRNILVGLLITGLMPTIVADATVIENYKTYKTTDFATNCAVFKPLKCRRKAQAVGIGANFELKNLAHLLLSRSLFSSCAKRSSATINKNCLLAWQGKVKKKLSTELIQHHRDRDRLIGSTGAKFPHLTRSSLILSSPVQGYTDDKLANPAPATKRIASPFGWRRRPYSNQLQFHQGIDYGAPLGSPVVSVGNGIVTKISSGCLDFSNLSCGGQLGNWIEVDHGNGAIAVYGHLKHNSLNVTKGMRVRKNQQIAQVGSSGWSTGAHLDFRIKVHGEYADPAKLIMSIDVDDTPK